MNYNLATDVQYIPQRDFLIKRLGEVITTGRRTQNVMCVWVVTLPIDVNEKDEELFFKETFNFLADKYGHENVISAFVHKDQTTPHMHFAWVPVEKETNKLNAVAIINRNSLRKFHSEYAKHINAILGYDCGVINGVTQEQGGNRTIKELRKLNNSNINCIDLLGKDIYFINKFNMIQINTIVSLEVDPVYSHNLALGFSDAELKEHIIIKTLNLKTFKLSEINKTFFLDENDAQKERTRKEVGFDLCTRKTLGYKGKPISLSHYYFLEKKDKSIKKGKFSISLYQTIFETEDGEVYTLEELVKEFSRFYYKD